ncbi:ABC transporter ATP-binding protein [Dubosiella newyorkensis]|uniref:ABC transporter ATP-binding protein n=3 Tax=Dubosiella newyorkensis TaxID=1862672 RepID=A0A1U7NKL7_9FIRM|nr:ATP-binding cassette domain-containing protein [Dubosiella newyorkensis]OLU44872.1 ABC transporter ATP-binding protein [Dubosiella newyorkensis]
MLKLEHINVIYNEGTKLEKRALDDVSVHIRPGEFVTILGSNGAGKSTFFNVITGQAPTQSGNVILDGKDITHEKEHIRSKTIGRLFQNPAQGTAAGLTVEENLALSAHNNASLFSFAVKKKDIALFQKKLKVLNMGLEERLKTPIGLLSGGQRQAVALIMAVLNPPKLLLLDEHTAALDPKSAKTILEITDQLVRSEQMTALMITHNMSDALKYGDRLLIFNDGKITKDFSKEEKEKLKPADLLEFYEV